MSIPKVTLLFGDYANGFGIDSLEILVSSGDPAQTIVGEAQEYDPSPSILIDASNVTIGAPHAGMTIVASPPAAGGYGLPSEAIELGGPGVSNVTIQGNTIDPFGGGGTFSYGSYGIVTSPGDDNLTIGGFAAGAGNTFVGGSLDGIQVPEDPYAVWVQGAVDDPGPANALVWYGTASTNANIIGNSFLGSVDVAQIQDDASSGSIANNTFNASVGYWQGEAASAVSLGLLPASQVARDAVELNETFSNPNPADIRVVNNNFDNWDGFDIKTPLAAYNFVKGAPENFNAQVGDNGFETDTLNNYRVGDTVNFDIPAGPIDYTGFVPVVKQMGPNQVDIFMDTPKTEIHSITLATLADLTPDGDKIVLQSASGVSAAQVASTLFWNPLIVPALSAGNGTDVINIAPQQGTDLTSFVDNLIGGDGGTVQAVTMLSGPGSVAVSNGDVSFASGLSQGVTKFSYTALSQYGDKATGIVTVANDPGPAAHVANAVVGHSQVGANITSQVLAGVTPGVAADTDKVLGIGTIAASGSLALGNGKLTYTPAAGGTHDVFTYEVANQYGQTSQNFLNVTVDPGPTIGAAYVALPAAGATPTDLTSAMLSAAMPGMAGDSLKITAIGTPADGPATLSNGDVTYTPIAATHAGEMALLHQFANFGVASDSLTYTVAGQFGDKASGLLHLTLQPLTLNAPAGNGVTVTGNEPTQVITASGSGDTINLSAGAVSDMVVFAQQGGAVVNTGAGSSAVVNLTGDNNTVQGGDGWLDIAGGRNGNLVQLGNGSDNVSLTGSNNTIRLGNGNDSATLPGSGNSLSMGSGNDSVTVGGGDNDVALGAGNDSVTMGLDSVGSDTFVLTGSDASLALHGSNNAVFIYGGADAITDSPFGADALTLHLGATGGIASVSNFSPAMGVIDLAPQLVDGGVLGAAPTAQDVATYMNGNGGLLLFANNAGALVLSGAAGNLSANNFHIG